MKMKWAETSRATRIPKVPDSRGIQKHIETVYRTQFTFRGQTVYAHRIICVKKEVLWRHRTFAVPDPPPIITNEVGWILNENPSPLLNQKNYQPHTYGGSSLESALEWFHRRLE